MVWITWCSKHKRSHVESVLRSKRKANMTSFRVVAMTSKKDSYARWTTWKVSTTTIKSKTSWTLFQLLPMSPSVRTSPSLPKPIRQTLWPLLTGLLYTNPYSMGLRQSTERLKAMDPTTRLRISISNWILSPLERTIEAANGYRVSKTVRFTKGRTNSLIAAVSQIWFILSRLIMLTRGVELCCPGRKCLSVRKAKILYKVRQEIIMNRIID